MFYDKITNRNDLYVRTKDAIQKFTYKYTQINKITFKPNSL